MLSACQRKTTPTSSPPASRSSNRHAPTKEIPQETRDFIESGFSPTFGLHLGQKWEIIHSRVLCVRKSTLMRPKIHSRSSTTMPWLPTDQFVRGSCGVVQADEVFLEIRTQCAYSTDCFVGSCCVESKPRNAMSGADAARRHEDNPSWPRPVLKTPRRSEQWQKRSMCRV